MTAAAEILGSEVQDALEAAGHSPAPEGSGSDGFDILKPRNADDHVVVITRFEGAMYGMGFPNVRTAETLKLARALDDTDFVVGLVEQDRRARAVVVARDARAADRALAILDEAS